MRIDFDTICYSREFQSLVGSVEINLIKISFLIHILFQSLVGSVEIQSGKTNKFIRTQFQSLVGSVEIESREIF